MALRYLTGEEIQRSDRVRFGGKVGVIEDVVEACTGTPEQDWLFETHGAGVMVAEPEVVGRIYTIPKGTRTFSSSAALSDMSGTGRGFLEGRDGVTVE